MIKITFILPSLGTGGAEQQLLNLLKGLNTNQFDPLVITYYPADSTIERAVRALPNIRYHCLKLRNRFDLPRLLGSLARILNREKQDILYGLLGDACTLAMFHGKLTSQSKVVWGLRASNMDFNRYSRISGWIFRTNSRLSGLADRIIANSRAGMDYHISQGYRSEKTVVIANGMDTRYFCRQPGEICKLRKEWLLENGQPIIGRIGRLDAMKDYETFIRAAALLGRHNTKVRFVIVGGGPTEYQSQLVSLAEKHAISGQILWLGTRNDLPAIYSTCTLTSSSSFGEGFPNVVAESLSCETPCIATKVGDTGLILKGGGGWTVPPKNPQALAQAWGEILAMSEDERRSMGVEGRRHVVTNFSLEKMVAETEQVFLELYRNEKQIKKLAFDTAISGKKEKR